MKFFFFSPVWPKYLVVLTCAGLKGILNITESTKSTATTKCILVLKTGGEMGSGLQKTKYNVIFVIRFYPVVITFISKVYCIHQSLIQS